MTSTLRCGATTHPEGDVSVCPDPYCRICRDESGEGRDAADAIEQESLRTTEPHRPLTRDEVAKRLDEEGFEAATVTLRKWVARETINAADLLAEMRFWVGYLGG